MEQAFLFLDSWVTSAPDLQLYTDAASTVGFGAYFNGKWSQGRWHSHLLIDKCNGIRIEQQEIFPIVVTCALCYPYFSSKRLQFWCDNESMVAIINLGHSKPLGSWTWFASYCSFPWNTVSWWGSSCLWGKKWNCWFPFPFFWFNALGNSTPVLTRAPVPSCLPSWPSEGWSP